MTEEKKEVAISVRDVTKEFKVYYKSGSAMGSTNSSAPRGLSSLLGKSKYEKVEILKGVSFDIMKGEMVGILGRNGAGKSTLLRIVGGIIEPTKGSVKVNGKVTSLMGFSTGLNKKLTARENIVQYGLILGLSKREVTERAEDVLEFAGLDKFADFQISHFSSGMNARLAFSATLLIDPDILLLDEALAVGDYYFHQKSIDAFERIRKRSGTILMVSHAFSNIKRYCDRVMLLNNGKIETIGDPETVIRKYLDLGYENESSASITQQYDDDEFKDLDSATNENAITSADAIGNISPVENTASASNEVASQPAIEAPTNIFPEGSPFLEGMPKVPIRKLRWRGKLLVEDNAFAIKDKSILDIRCQNGQFMHAALQAGARYVEGLEKQHELVEIARENLATCYGSDAENNRYKINEGSLLAMLRKIKPNTFDTIFCFGVMNKLINHAGLMQQIDRIKPSYLIIDVNVSKASEAVMEFDVAKADDSSVSSEDSETATDGKNVGLPSKAAIELLLSTYKFTSAYVDWSKAAVSNQAGLEEYLTNQRLSIIASRIQ